MRQYERFRTPPLAALYRALDAGLTGEKPEVAGHAIMSIAAAEGLDVVNPMVYDVAIHYAHLATILATYLRAQGPPWVHVKDVKLGRHTWESACYEAGQIRRVALIDYWSDDRRDQELRSWRTQGEIVALERPLLLNAISIGHVLENRRSSPWTRAWAHPQNGHIRFQRKTSTEGFAGTWKRQWRETSDLRTEQWLDQMLRDRVFDDLVHTVAAAVPPRVDDIREDMLRMAREMESAKAVPPMRRTGCHGFSRCPFIAVCYGAREPVPSIYGFRRKQPAHGVPASDIIPGPDLGPNGPKVVQIGKMRA